MNPKIDLRILMQMFASGARQKMPGWRSVASSRGKWVHASSGPVSIILLLLLNTGVSADLPAFPGAEGAGALAVGGRGGNICEVINLHDSGPGSLRACIELAGPRTVIFRVGGTIELERFLWIRNPYITIAGQTAPGGGIQIKPVDKGLDDSAGPKSLIIVSTHDVVIRYLRLRSGRGLTDTQGANLGLTDSGGGNVYNVIVDHVSSMWHEGNNMGGWGRSTTRAPRNVTLQNNLLAETLQGHSVTMNWGATNAANALGMTNIDIHNNLFANTNHRNPLFKAAQGRIVNNIFYQWSLYATQAGSGPHLDIIGNFYKLGPTGASSSRRSEVQLFNLDRSLVPSGSWPENGGHYIDRTPSVYVAGNQGPWWETPDVDNWGMTARVAYENQGILSRPAPVGWKRSQPLNPVGVPITVRHVNELDTHVLPGVGASSRLDCRGNWVSNRDRVDERIVNEYLTKSGRTPVEHEDEVGGHPELQSGSPCRDMSGDGIPDEWLVANGFDPMDPSLGASFHESGYTYLELYLSGTQVRGATPLAPGGISVE